ncbi:lipid II flippase MurJ [Roseburia hominis]
MRSENKQGETGVIKNSIAISFVVLIGKALGFVKQAVIAWAFGANATTDIYFAADGYTSMFGQIMGTSVAPTVLTRYIKLDEEGNKGRAKQLIKESFFFFGMVGLILVGINVLISSNICNLIGISYTASQKRELRFFVIALCPVMLFTSLSGVAQGYLDAHKRFLPAKLCSLFFSVFIIISIVFFRHFLGLRSLLYGFLFGYVAHTIYMLSLVVSKTGVFIGNPFKNPEFCHMMKRFGPLVVGNSIVDLGHLVDKIVASALPAGSVSALYYGQVISSDLVNAVIVTSIGTVLLTTLTKSVASNFERNVIKDRLQFIICAMTLLTGLIAALYFVEGYDLIKLFFERGNFDSNSTALVASIATCYSFGFVFMANREVLIKAHYAYQDTLTPMINSIIGVIINLIGSIVLSRIIGIAGVAVATSVSMALVALLSLFTIKKHLEEFPIKKKGATDLAKILVAIFVTIITGKILLSILENYNSFLRLLIVGMTMVIVYLGVSVATKELVVKKVIIPWIKNRIRK